MATALFIKNLRTTDVMNITDLQEIFGPFFFFFNSFATLLIVQLFCPTFAKSFLLPFLEKTVSVTVGVFGKIIGCLVIFGLAHILFYLPGRILLEKAGSTKALTKIYGMPIVNSIVSFENKIFRPKAIVVVDGRTMIYAEDNKVYALDGINIPFKMGDMPVGTNIAYTIYSRSNTLWLAKLEM